MKKIYLFFVLLGLSMFNVSVFAQTQTMDGMNMSTGVIDNDSDSDDSSMSAGNVVSKSIETTAQNTQADSDNDDSQIDNSPSKVDANGNLTIKSGEEYQSAINLSRGNLIIKDGAAVLNSIYLGSGNVTLEDNSEVKGNITVKSGTLKIGNNADVYGNISAYTMSVGDNVDITGSVDITSAATVISMGNNSSIGKTLTSKASLKIGSNGEVELFLSGESAEVDGKMYKLGGKILSSGANTAVRLPFVPKLKNADGSEVKVTNTPPTSLPAVNSSASATGEENSKSNTGSEGSNPSEEKSDSVDDDSISYYNSAAAMADVEKIMNTEDLNAYVTKVSGIDTSVSDLNLSGEAVDMDYEVPAELFGFISMPISANVKVSKDKNVDVEFPWYSFMFSTPSDENAIEETVSSAVKSSFNDSTVTTEGLSAKLQASITKNVLSGLKGLFGGTKK